MRKRIVFCWFVIILFWAFLIFFIFEESNEIKNSLSNTQSYLTGIYKQLIDESATMQPQQIELIPDESWYQVCKESGFKLIPNCETTPVSGIEDLVSYYIKINSDGFRGREYSIEKPNDVSRIIALGDSFTFGFGLNLEETFCSQLEKILNQKSPGKKFEVLNLGMPGANTVLEIEHFKEKGLKYNPDLVIIGFLHNDDETLEFNDILEGYKKGQEQHIAYEELKSNKTLKNVDFIKRPLEELEKISKKSDFKILVYAFNPDDDQYAFFKEFEKFNDNTYFQKASFNWENDRKFYLHPADKHPSSLANQLYAQEIYNTLREHGLIP